jgi:hypothetical protein
MSKHGTPWEVIIAPETIHRYHRKLFLCIDSRWLVQWNAAQNAIDYEVFSALEPEEANADPNFSLIAEIGFNIEKGLQPPFIFIQ